MFEKYIKLNKEYDINESKISQFNSNLGEVNKKKNVLPILILFAILFCSFFALESLSYAIAEISGVFEGRYKVVLGDQSLENLASSVSYKSSFLQNLIFSAPFAFVLYFSITLAYYFYDNITENKTKWYSFSYTAIHSNGAFIVPAAFSALLWLFMSVEPDFVVFFVYPVLFMFCGVYSMVCFFYFLRIKANTKNATEENKQLLISRRKELNQTISDLKIKILNNEKEIRRIAEITCLQSDGNNSLSFYGNSLLNELKSFHAQKNRLKEINSDIDFIFGAEEKVENKIINE